MIFRNRSNINKHINEFTKLYFLLVLIGNLTTFISSDGPVIHFWLISFLFFFFFILKYKEINEMNG